MTDPNYNKGQLAVDPQAGYTPYPVLDQGQVPPGGVQPPQYSQAPPPYYMPTPQPPPTVMVQPGLVPVSGPQAAPMVVTAFPQGHVPPLQPGEIRDWSSGLCGCFSDFGWCLITCFCPCITEYQVAIRAGHPKTAQTMLGLTMAIIFCQIMSSSMASYPAVSAIFYVLVVGLGICSFIVLFLFREKFRNLFLIAGDSFKDCCATFWCSSCVLCQMKRELDYYQYDARVVVVKSSYPNMPTAPGPVPMATPPPHPY